MANSRARTVDRANIRLATFKQALAHDGGHYTVQTHRGQQDKQERPYVAHYLLFQRNKVCADALIGIWKSRRQVPRHSVHIGSRLLNRYSWLEARDTVEA